MGLVGERIGTKKEKLTMPVHASLAADRYAEQCSAHSHLLFENGKIETTVTRAKSAPIAERWTHAKTLLLQIKDSFYLTLQKKRSYININEMHRSMSQETAAIRALCEWVRAAAMRPRWR